MKQKAIVLFSSGLDSTTVLYYAMSKGYDCNTIDGVRVTFSDGWALVRASNTGPNLTARFEATTEEKLNAYQEEFVNLINEYNK